MKEEITLCLPNLGFGTTAIVYSIFAVAVIYYMAFNCHETEEAQNRPKAKLLGSIRDMVSVLFGYVSGDQPGPTPDVAARFLMSYYPFVIMIACCIR